MLKEWRLIYHNLWLALLSSTGRINRKRMELALLDHGRVRVLVRVPLSAQSRVRSQLLHLKKGEGDLVDRAPRIIRNTYSRGLAIFAQIEIQGINVRTLREPPARE